MGNGDDLMTMMKTTKAGRVSLTTKTPARLKRSDLSTWRECFAAAIAGAVAAHRRVPNAESVVKFAAQIADHALDESRKRKAA